MIKDNQFDFHKQKLFAGIDTHAKQWMCRNMYTVPVFLSLREAE